MSLLSTGAVAVAILSGVAATPWKSHQGAHCWTGHGATEIDIHPIRSMSIADCEVRCDQTADCTAITVMMKGRRVFCWRQKDIDLDKCQLQTRFDTWVKDPAPAPAPPPPAPPAPSPSPSPTTVPAFIKAFIEGLLSDGGTDAKQCEGDAAAFASAMESLAGATVGSAKAVAAAIEEAKEKCTTVAKDAKRLAASAIGDVFHPIRILKNYLATSRDVVREIVFAVEALAKRDFKGAGDNAGKITRRLIEGSQDEDADSTSSYTEMGELNCYQDHGATDLEKDPGQPCGEMSLAECEQKCDELSGCQGITVSAASEGKVMCYRRGSIKVDHCDHQAVGFDTFLNQNAQLPDASNTIASASMYTVAYWSAAAMTQDSLASESPEHWGSFLEGLLEGLMSDGTDFSDCQADIPAVGQALQTAKKKVGKALAATLAAGKIAKQSCGTAAGDAEKLAKAAFNDLMHPDQVLQHFQDTQSDFLTEVGEAFIALAKNDYSTAGTDMGMAIRRIIEGKQTAEVIV